jgi:hypothetical protein
VPRREAAEAPDHYHASSLSRAAAEGGHRRLSVAHARSLDAEYDP